ncbi:Aldo/keto reductase [Mollisia scopiformis]|uniref:Aldo/keto reductase n=1 Tax=Mollisia scopiformis TaxID=149040 RepID=A0A194X629_MOLSC|nr:Aldo/keto reductase [Mollisia scopiformis]KUJ15262.1 Aldo/keto reductase [Mollisia scopiformis]
MTSSSTKLKIVFGAMTIGKENTLGARVYTKEGANALIDLFQKHGHNEIDTARVYGFGTTEQILAETDWEKRGIVMDTKLYPNRGGPLSDMEVYDHTPEDVRRGLMDSLKALNCKKIDMFYLHGPDRKHPFEDTLREVNKLHQEGYFTRFGVSNYQSWEVAKICEICEKNGWIKPTAYQGIYHALQRSIEAELFPCLRHYGIALYAFQPLAGGFLTGRYTRDQEDFEPGSRFDPKKYQGTLHRGRYWNDSYFDALDIIKPAAEKHGLTIAEVAMRWIEHHSTMKKEFNDAIIIGASSTKHLEENLKDLEKGPLPEDVVEVLEAAWLKTKGVAPKYWH